MPQHCSKKHRFPWGEGTGAIFALDEVFWYLSPSAGVPGGQLWLCPCPRASVCPPAGVESLPGVPPPLLDSRLGVSGASLSHFSPVQTADTRATRSAAASSSWIAAGRASARASSRLRAPSCRPAARYAGEGAPWGGRQPHGDRLHLLQRPDFLLPKGFTGGRSCQRGQSICPADPGSAH